MMTYNYGFSIIVEPYDEGFFLNIHFCRFVCIEVHLLYEDFFVYRLYNEDFFVYRLSLEVHLILDTK